jgi:exodeoxyribonuclease V alpha subunit
VNSAPQAQLEPSTREVLAGLVERITFHNPENGFCVLRIKARGHRDLITVIGHAAVIAAGEWVTASGEWVNDRTHGQQFKSRFMRTSAPTSIDGIEKYLGSGMIRGIGPVYAKKLVRAFGEKVFDVIEAEPDRLREVTGIGPLRAKRITGAWAEQKIVREIMVFLHSHGVGTARAVRIFKTYGADAVQVMTENPYRLARDIRGIGFKTADAIAMKLGIEKTAMIRVRAGISYALTEAMDEGHCGLPTEELTPLAVELLEVPRELIQTALDLELAERTVIADTVEGRACIFLAGLYRAEQVIAQRILQLANGTLPRPYVDPAKALPWIEQKTGLSLAESQIVAIRLALLSKILVITGGPGVGKTTIVNSILRILAAKGASLLLCAPTGRAAKRMTEATGFEAKTIHRLLEVDPKGGGFKRGSDNPLDCDLLVVDETSMVDVMLMQALMRAVPDDAALLIVGDIDQLPSVGPSQVLADIIASGAVPVVRLTEVFRQAAHSRIITSAHQINRGSIPDLSMPEGNSDFYFDIAKSSHFPFHVGSLLELGRVMRTALAHVGTPVFLQSRVEPAVSCQAVPPPKNNLSADTPVRKVIGAHRRLPRANGLNSIRCGLAGPSAEPEPGRSDPDVMPDSESHGSGARCYPSGGPARLLGCQWWARSGGQYER